MPRTTPATPAEPAAPPTSAEPAALRADILLRAFLEGAGLPQMQLTEDQLPEVMANLGAIFRETVRGLMEILLARGDIKGEFRLARTAMGPVENNPLKTPPGRPPLSPDEVMTLLLIRQKEAYMSPVQAVREGFNDIKAHQLAVMAGIQAALHRLLARFDPGNLATRLEQSVFDNIWPANRKAKYWDLFTAEYQAIAREAEDDFNELFGDEFARAYEERLRGH
jgi:type VI secretion system protein